MIKILKKNNNKPYQKFYKLYDLAVKKNQHNIEAINISSLNVKLKEVNSRYVNLKYINGDEWIFFTNYNSPKSIEFKMHNQISCNFYWNILNVQIRMKANINKVSDDFSNAHFLKRSNEKNALAVSSNQSAYIESYDHVQENYENTLLKSKKIKIRPDYWGGFSFIPYYFEFWEGHTSRVNKREVFIFKNNYWNNFFIQP